MQFVIKNLGWIALALVSGILLIWPSLRRGASGTRDFSVTEAVLWMNREHALVLDVRNSAEFATGHIAEARNIPLETLPEQLKSLQKYKTKPVLVHCQAGMRSAKACQLLKQAGFANVGNLKGGLNAWRQANLPLVKDN